MEQELEQLMTKGVRQLEAGKLLSAQGIFLEILDRDPEYSPAINKLGVISAIKKDFEKAESYFLKAINLSPKFSSPYTNLGNIYFERGEMERAEELYKKAIFLDPSNPLPHNNLAVIQKSRGNITEFVKTYKESQRLEGKSSREGTINEMKDLISNRTTTNLSPQTKFLLYGGIAIIIIGVLLYLL